MEILIYLDTHVVIWLYAGNTEYIPSKTLELMKTQELLLSPMVLLEMTYLFEIKRLTVTSDQIMNTLIPIIDIKVSELPYSSVIEYAIQQSWTRDPFDRIIVGQAAVKSSLLITKDSHILAHYAYALWS